MLTARKYSQLQRDAVELAYGARAIRPVRRISELAAAGELEVDGVQLEPFEIPPGSARDIGARAASRRINGARRKLAELPPADALEYCRRQLLGVIDGELERMRRSKTLDAAKVRELVRCIRELATLPGPAGEAAPNPAAGTSTDRSSRADGRPMVAGLAGEIKRALEPRPIAAPDDVYTLTQEPGADPASAHQHDNARQEPEPEEPGEYALSRIRLLSPPSSSPASST